MTQHSLRVPNSLDSRPRPTPADPKLDTAPSNGLPNFDRTRSKLQPIDTKNFTSDKATIAFVRRTLCSHHVPTSGSAPRPLDELLPPLTSSNDVDIQLYAILGVILKDFVYTWYAKITPDHVFVDEVLQVIAHCTRALEQRVRHVDLESLLLDEIPALLEAHVRAYRVAQRTTVSIRCLRS